uniref:Uncharacterized protein n=1 Tax=viral metagenome TaxID=1070528 RepID=A0A6C0J2P2_9ZZZZ
MRNQGVNRMPSVKGHIVNLTANLVIVGLVYLICGIVVSWMISNTFPHYDESWKKQSVSMQILDVAAEVSMLVILAFWSSYAVDWIIPILPVAPILEKYIETFGGRMIFLYAVFLFIHDLDEKLTYLYTEFLGKA